MGIFGAFKGKRDEETKRRAMQHVTQGKIYTKSGQLSAGIAEFEKAITIDPECADAYYSMGFACNALARSENERVGGTIYFSAGLDNLNKVISAFEKVVKLQPNAADAYLGLGTAYDNACRFEDAERCYRETIKLDPEGIDGADGYFNLSLLLYMRAVGWLGSKKQFPNMIVFDREKYAIRDQAIELAEKGIQIGERLIQRRPEFRPDLVKFHRRLAKWLDQAGKGSDAILHFQAILKLVPSDPEAHTWLQQAEKNTGRKLL